MQTPGLRGDFESIGLIFFAFESDNKLFEVGLRWAGANASHLILRFPNRSHMTRTLLTVTNLKRSH